MVDAKSLTRRSVVCVAAKTAIALTAGSWISGCSDASAGGPDDAGSSGNEPPPGPLPPLPKSVAGISLPDSPLALAAASLCFSESPGHLYNHCMRAYVFSALLFEKLGKRYDAELAFLGAVLHDLGLVEAYMSPDERFELDGADAAMKFMQARGVPRERAEVVWDAIALHTNATIAQRKAPEIAMVALGAAMDVAGGSLDRLAASDVERVLEVFPRLGFKQASIQTMISQCETKPLAYVLHPFADVGRRHIPGFVSPTVEDLMLAAPFSE